MSVVFANPPFKSCALKAPDSVATIVGRLTMANSEMANLNRTLQEMTHNQKKMTRILEALNENLVELIKRLPSSEGSDVQTTE